MAVIKATGGRVPAPVKPPAKPVVKAAPKVTVGPQNVGLPGYRPGDPGVGYGATTGYVAPAVTPAPDVPVAPPPPPLDFNALTLADSQWIDQSQDLAAQNKLSTDALSLAFARNSQSSQDSFNAGNALHSGAAVNAQKSLSAANDQAVLQQKLNFDEGGHNLYHSVFNRLVDQLGGGSSNG